MTMKSNDPKKPTCVLDNDVVNAKTIGKMTDMGLSFFATLCGRNRGAFVLDPTDGHTWGCTEFPPNFATLAGVNTTMTVKDANDIKKLFENKNVTAADTVAFLNFFSQRVYGSSPGVEKDVYACNTAGLSKLQCAPVNAIPTIRAVATTGLFVPAPWATGNRTLSATSARRRAFYTADDFDEMASLGINTVQIPFPLMAFAPDMSNVSHDVNLVSDLTRILKYIKRTGTLQAIIVLDGADNDDAVAAAARYAVSHGDTVFALSLPSSQSIGAARAADAELKLFVPASQGDLPTLSFPDDNIFAALDLSHTSGVGEVASSTSLDDRMKIFYVSLCFSSFCLLPC